MKYIALFFFIGAFRLDMTNNKNHLTDQFSQNEIKN